MVQNCMPTDAEYFRQIKAIPILLALLRDTLSTHCLLGVQKDNVLVQPPKGVQLQI